MCVQDKASTENSALTQKQIKIIEPRSFAQSISEWCKLHQNEVLIADQNANGELHHGQSSLPFLISLQKRKCLTPCLELALSLGSSGLNLIHRRKSCFVVCCLQKITLQKCFSSKERSEMKVAAWNTSELAVILHWVFVKWLTIHFRNMWTVANTYKPLESPRIYLFIFYTKDME